MWTMTQSQTKHLPTGSVKEIGEVDLKLIARVSMAQSEIDNLIPNCVSLHNLWEI